MLLLNDDSENARCEIDCLFYCFSSVSRSDRSVDAITFSSIRRLSAF